VDEKDGPKAIRTPIERVADLPRFRQEVSMSTPQHCPGFEQFKNLKSFLCKCPNCGKETEIFSDEFNKAHVCKGCQKEIDFTKCTVGGVATDTSPR